MFDYAEAFEQAKRMDQALLNKIREAVWAALEQGLSFDEFTESVSALTGCEAVAHRRDHE
ncbi:hypothetical protein NM74_07985 [Aeromonas hydrophila]|uniref:hypothetical protein n=1 Tax=Aeromonas hydrophila TaxID=644 RepID=UPI000538CC51|nr:hypothetical protein [Aeromonas hydrophila]KHA57145.1 hypothetical protein NM74_07985 [Aeromonas hydrophila]